MRWMQCTAPHLRRRGKRAQGSAQYCFEMRGKGCRELGSATLSMHVLFVEEGGKSAELPARIVMRCGGRGRAKEG